MRWAQEAAFDCLYVPRDSPAIDCFEHIANLDPLQFAAVDLTPGCNLSDHHAWLSGMQRQTESNADHSLQRRMKPGTLRRMREAAHAHVAAVGHGKARRAHRELRLLPEIARNEAP